MSKKSLLVFYLPLVVLTVMVSWKAQLRIQARAITLGSPSLNCTHPPTFSTGYQRESNGVAPVGQGFDFQGVAWIQADLCSPGMLQLTAEGQVADGQDPILQIGLNSETLASEAFNKRRSVNVRVPHSGRLTLGYFNDFYLSDVRIATLENMRFSGSGCEKLNVQVPKATGGLWTPETKTASLVFSVPMTVTPCSAGTLATGLVGHAGMKVFPLVEFQQQGKLLLRVQTGINRKAVRLNIMAAPLKIILTNPYFRQLGDRNLELLSVQYFPDPIINPKNLQFRATGEIQ